MSTKSAEDHLTLPKCGPCKWCGHKWHPRQERMPKRCAKCKRPNWQKGGITRKHA